MYRHEELPTSLLVTFIAIAPYAPDLYSDALPPTMLQQRSKGINQHRTTVADNGKKGVRVEEFGVQGPTELGCFKLGFFGLRVLVFSLRLEV